MVASKDTEQDTEKDMIETNAELVERAISEYQSPLIGFARTIVHDTDRARDIVQDTFIRLYQQDVGKVRAKIMAFYRV
jgi:DNA-directed RNA polymerase specialized sigma24 family protein